MNALQEILQEVSAVVESIEVDKHKWTGFEYGNQYNRYLGSCRYLSIMHTKWGREHEDYQYAIMLAAIPVCMSDWRGIAYAFLA